jgi:dihydroorotate dehydrogenase electron transfer subunit
MLDLPEEAFYFRRPFSVLAAYEDNVFEIYYKVVGVGTTKMAQLMPGDEVNVLGPLGNGFAMPVQPEKALLIGGGIGIAPMVYIAKELKAQGQPAPTCFYGVRSANEIGLSDELTQALTPARVHLATDDGTHGFHGNVCQLMAQHLETVRSATDAYVCGPTPMMDAVVQSLTQWNPGIRIQVSLEEHMPCGTGACTGCVVARNDGKLPSKTCVDGPVFDASVIRWPSQSTGVWLEDATCCR